MSPIPEQDEAERLFWADSITKRYRRPGGRKQQPGLSLDNVSIAVHRGEVVGCIGRNGAGKSTLLKIAAGVTKESSGHVHRPEHIAPLIEVGAGFHPELTGRENVIINAKLLGLRRREIASKFDSIVAFAELAHVIDRPVREYSSGMFMRLGFAVAVHTEPELLVVDEVLAVGDISFQARCLARIKEIRDQGAGVLFVSHDLTAVQNLCDRALLLDHGKPLVLGPVEDAIGMYHQVLSGTATGAEPSGNEKFEDRPPSGELSITSVSLSAAEGDTQVLWQPGSRVVVAVELRAESDTPEGIPGIQLIRDDVGIICRSHDDNGQLVPSLQAGQTVLVKFFLQLNVSEGAYRVDIAVARRDWSAIMANQFGAITIGVGRRYGTTGLADLGVAVTVEHDDAAPAQP